MRVEQTENVALIKHDDYDNQEQNSEQDKRWVDGETLQDTLGRTQNGLNMDNEGEKSAKDDSYASSQSNWTDGIVFTDIRNMCRGPTRCEARKGKPRMHEEEQRGQCDCRRANEGQSRR